MKNDIKNIWFEIRNSFQSGGFKYFFHNLSVNFRNWNFNERKTIIQKIVYSLGVWLIDPSCKYYWDMVKYPNILGNPHSHWQFHPFPLIRKHYLLNFSRAAKQER